MVDRNTASRLRTAVAKSKALDQYNELRRSGRVKSAIVIAEMTDGSWTILGQRMTPGEMARGLMLAADSLANAEENRRIERVLIKPEPHEQPISQGPIDKPSLKTRAITRDAEGILVPPYGENFVSCGECCHPRWYVLHTNADDVIARMACAHCGNEVIHVEVDL